MVGIVPIVEEGISISHKLYCQGRGTVPVSQQYIKFNTLYRDRHVSTVVLDSSYRKNLLFRLGAFCDVNFEHT